jgi:hypothetical protein
VTPRTTARIRIAWLATLLVGVSAGPLTGQAYRLRLESRIQTVSFRGLSLDSVPLEETVTGPTGGLETTGGRSVTCPAGTGICLFYLPGPRLASAPLVNSADVTVWQLGLAGLSLRANGRWGTDLRGEDPWPGTHPALQLLDGYAEYAAPAFTARLGRQHVTGRLGWAGLDGATVTLRPRPRWPELSAYGGWGLARGLDIPATSPALNPLEDYQLPRRQITAGGTVTWRRARVDLSAEYRRELDPASDQFVSERAALVALVRPLDHFAVTGGAEYNLGEGWWSTSDLMVRYDAGRVGADVGVRRYRPSFPLYTIWGSFSPVGYTSVEGSATATVVTALRLRAGGERYWFDGTGAETALNAFEDRGWRLSLSATATPAARLALEGSYTREFGPGASLESWEGRATWRPGPSLALSASGSTLLRPLELRFDEARVESMGVGADWQASERLQLSLSGAQYFQDHRRPDPGAFDWNQFRAQARIAWLLGSDADRWRLPPATSRRRRAP